jgi:hypothetical protein
VVVGPPGVKLGTATVTVVPPELVAVEGDGVVAVTVTPVCGVMTVPVTAVDAVDGVPGVPPRARAVCAAAVCLANSSIICIGFSTDGKGETNNPVGTEVVVAAGASDRENVQLEINIALINRVATTMRPRCF